MNELTTIQLNPTEARLFIEFRKRQDSFQNYLKNEITFNFLKEMQVFNVRNGKAILSFDSAGTINSIDFEVSGFKRGMPDIQIITLLK